MSISPTPLRRRGEATKEDTMYVSNLSQLVDVTDRQRREMDEQLGRLASIWSRRLPGRRRQPAPERCGPTP
jgi:hypothetical protein